MPIEEPHWWYKNRHAWQSLALAPVGSLYGMVSARRMAQGPRYVSKFPVLCAGNVTVGGTGKTPLSVALADIVRELGFEPVFLTRGYGGSDVGPLAVDTHSATAAQVGDEPLLLARAAATIVARDRVQGAKLIEKTFGARTIIIMDDGLQNPALAKDFSVLVVDVKRRFGNGRCLPAGPLRVPLANQLPRIGAVLLNGSATPDEAAKAEAMISAAYSGPILRGEAAPAGDLKWLKGASVLAYAGIANPGRFFALLEREGARILAQRTFTDHHVFTHAEAEALLAEAGTLNARLVTTEKDFVRLYGAQGSLATLRDQSLTLPIVLHLPDDGHERLAALVLQATEIKKR
ncbi:MAG: tetraacyldisaccharide 4'-kinase [Hyphomicrobium sp.]